jgi:outer membrane autotransporter protein
VTGGRGADGAGIITPGGGGGGGTAIYWAIPGGTSTISAGSIVTGGVGGTGTTSISAAAAGGGGGGTGVAATGSGFTLNVQSGASVSGGAGGRGGGSIDVSAGGGGGGGGDAVLLLGTNDAVSNDGTITGGVGGAGGADFNNAGGRDGASGAGVNLAGGAQTLTNHGTITGGASSGPTGAAGAAVVSYGDATDISNFASLIGGLQADGSHAPAIDIEGNGNFVSLAPTSVITGNLLSNGVNNKLILLSGDGSLANNVIGFSSINVPAGGNWELSSPQSLTRDLTFDTTGAGKLLASGEITGAKSVTLAGDGRLTLSAENTYSGGTTIAGSGVLVLDGNGTLGTGGLTISSNGILDISQSTAPLGITIPTLTDSGGGTIMLGNRGVVLGEGNTISTVSGSIVDGGIGGGTFGTVYINSDAVGSVTFSGVNTYTGPTIIRGRLNLVGNASLASEVDVQPGASFDISGLTNGGISVSRLMGDETSTIELGFNSLTVNNTAPFDSVVSGAINGVGGSLIKQGSGALILTGFNNYTGVTNLLGGSLYVGDAQATPMQIAGDVNTSNGTTLGGNGVIAGNVNVATGGRVAPGTIGGTGGTLIAHNLTMAAGSQLDFGFGIPGTPPSVYGLSDHIALAGDLALHGVTLNVTDEGGFGPGIYNMINYGGTLIDFDLVLGSTPVGGLSIQNLTGQKAINLINAGGPALNFWNGNGLASSTQMGGGDGTWSKTSPNWTDSTGSANGSMQPQPGFAIFGGAPGTVTVDNSAGAVQASGMQFASDGYVLKGGTLTLVDPAQNPVEVRVGDGSAASMGWTTTINNVIAGIDGLAKTGAGTLVLTGTNTYTGGTFIRAGALSVDSDAELGGVSGGVTLDGGLLRVTGTAFNHTARALGLGGNGGGFDIADAANTFTVDQDLSGPGGLIQQGAGTLVLSGTNSYMGGTLIGGGVLSADSDARLGGAAGGLTLDGGTLLVTGTAFNHAARTITLGNNGGGLDIADAANTFTLDQALSGNGGLNKLGAGTLLITADNTYRGTTTISGGTLQLGNGGTTGSISGDVINNGTLVLNRSDNATFGSAMTGSGNLLQSGPGSLTLTGDSSAFAGTSNVAAGTLMVNGKLGGALSIASGATLAGTGTVGNTTLAGGSILTPGNSSNPIGTLTVNGNLSFAPGSAYQVQADPTGTASDWVHVTGVANLAGTVIHVGPDGNFAPSQTYTILTADGGVNGAFDSVATGFTFLTPTLTYDPNDAFLTLKRNSTSFASLAQTGNQRAVAGALDSMLASAALPIAVSTVTAAQAPGTFDALSGEIHPSTTSVLQSISQNVASMPLDHLRNSLSAGAVNGPAMAQLGSGDSSALPSSAAQPVWAQVFGNWRTFDGDGNTGKVRESDGGLFVGADRAVGADWRLGGAFGYTGSHSSLQDRSSTSDVDSYSASIYGGKAFQAGPGKINLMLGTAYTWNDIHTKRNVGVAGLDQTLKADYGASTAQVFGELGYALPLNDNFTLEPFAGAAWSDLRTRGFSESGGSAALNGKSNSNNVTTTTLGLHARTAFAIQETQGHLNVTVGWRHAFGDVQPETTMAFDGSQAFTVAGAPLARDAAVVQLGADVAVTRNTTVGIAYSGQYGAGNQQNSGSVNVNWRF